MARRPRLASPLDPPDPRAVRNAGIALSCTAGAALGTAFGLLLGSVAGGIAAGAGCALLLALAALPGTPGTRT